MTRPVLALTLGLLGCTAPVESDFDPSALRMTDATGAELTLEDFTGDVIGLELVWLH